MLTIGKLGIGQENYYLDKVTEGAEDYYSGEGEAEGRWMGDAAEELGLDGEVGPDQLKAMLTGRNPVDGEPLVGMRGVPSKGQFQASTSPSQPRSRSHCSGRSAGPKRVPRSPAPITAPSKPPSTTLQREACWTRRGAGGLEFVKGNGYLAAAYVHRSSRNGDPQLHTHVFDRQCDLRTGRPLDPALPPGDLRPRQDIYEVQLRHELSRDLGVCWQEVRNGIAEIDSFADEHLRTFSTAARKSSRRPGRTPWLAHGRLPT